MPTFQGPFIGTSPTPYNDATDTLATPASAPASLPLAQQPSRPSRRRTSTHLLSIVSVTLHLTTVVFHLALIAIWASALELRVVSGLENEKTAAFLVTAIATTFGTAYFAILVYLTQTLAMRQNIRSQQMLTVTHDSSAAWAGLGAAFLSVWHQRNVRASIARVVSVLLYLGTVSALHVTTSTLFFVDTFTSSGTVTVPTQGLPVYNFSGFNLSNERIRSAVPCVSVDLYELTAFELRSSRFVKDSARGSLYFLPSVMNSEKKLGLNGTTLYDVLGSNSGTGNVTVNATGFDVRCGYLRPAPVDVDYSQLNDSIYIAATIGGTQYDVGPLAPRIISTARADGSGGPLFYSTVPIRDSENNYYPLDIDGSANRLASSSQGVQLFQCSLSRVLQTAIVDSRSRELLWVGPEILKNHSTWSPYVPSSHTDKELEISPGSSFLDAVCDYTAPPDLSSFLLQWQTWYSQMPPSIVLLDNRKQIYASVADSYLIQHLGLLPTGGAPGKPISVALHDLEYRLSELVASMFWTLGHIAPLPGYGVEMIYGNEQMLYNSAHVYNPLCPPALLQGEATVSVTTMGIRLNLNVIALVAGLIASACLTLMSLQFSQFRKSVIAGHAEEVTISGTGLLHSIWLYRNHEELWTRLKQVDDPTDINLRAAGMVSTQLVGRREEHPLCLLRA